MARRSRTIIAALLLFFALHAICDKPPPPLVASFFVDGFARSRRQVSGVFKQIKQTGAQIIALQGVRDARKVATTAGWRLGDAWRYVYPRQRGAARSLGVLYNDGEVALLSTQVYDAVAVGDGARPAFEARLKPRRGGAVLRLIVVDLERDAGLRTLQMRALAELLGTLSKQQDRVVLLGNFNAADSGDRGALEALANKSGTSWLSRDVGCTAYRRDGEGRCHGVALDHVFSVGDTKSVRAMGACARAGCSPGRCPRDVERVSPHCPLLVELSR